MNRDSFVFYKSFYEALQNVPKKYRSEVYDAVFEYAFEAREPSLSGVSRALWELIRPQLDASQKRYENAKKGAEYGKLGGRPKKKEEKEKPLKGYENETLNVNVNVNENVNDNENVNVSGLDSETQTHTHSSSNRPTNPQIAEAVIRGGYAMSADSVQRFIDYNNEHGWKLGLEEALKRWNERELTRKPEKINFLNNAVPRSGTEWEENESNKAKLIAMQQ